MKSGAGFLTAACVWMLMLMLVLIRSSDAGAASRAPCRLKDLTALTRSLVAGSLNSFDTANGENLGTWPPGFPQLEVRLTRPPNGTRVQCSLIFMAEGLQEVLNDQRDDLNPENTLLHEELQHAISSVRQLAGCARHVLGGHCSQRPPPPAVPENAFEKKQWSHTLLNTSTVYLDQLERKSGVEKTKGKKRMVKVMKSKGIQADL